MTLSTLRAVLRCTYECHKDRGNWKRNVDLGSFTLFTKDTCTQQQLVSFYFWLGYKTSCPPASFPPLSFITPWPNLVWFHGFQPQESLHLTQQAPGWVTQAAVSLRLRFDSSRHPDNVSAFGVAPAQITSLDQKNVELRQAVTASVGWTRPSLPALDVGWAKQWKCVHFEMSFFVVGGWGIIDDTRENTDGRNLAFDMLELVSCPLEVLTTASVLKQLKDHLLSIVTGFIGLLFFLDYTPQNKTGSRVVESTVKAPQVYFSVIV